MKDDRPTRRVVAPGATAAVVGCGAMGRGIAQLLAEADLEVLLFDARPGVGRAARESVAVDLAKLVARGKRTQARAAEILERLRPIDDLSALSPVDLVVEAIVEDLESKQRLFNDLERVVSEKALIATNTSSLSLAAISATCQHPERIAGFHFFNPAPVMKVVEVVGGVQTADEVCDALLDLARRFGHTAVRAADTPGFIVNHAGRAFVTEGLAILAEGVCTPAVLDDVLCDACGFKLGPCALLDLTGLDVSHPVMESIYHQYYEEPRYRPQVLTRRMLEGRRLGRKSDAGFFRYVDGQRLPHPAPASLSLPPPRVWIDPVRATAAERVRSMLAPGVELDDGAHPGDDSLIVLTPVGCDTTRSIAATGVDARRAVACDTLFPGHTVRCLFASPGLDTAWRERARAAFAAPGAVVHLVRDSVGLICQRVLAHVVNVACVVAEQRVGSPGDIDQAAMLGLGYPQGPLSWGNSIGPSIVRTVLDTMYATTGDARYRPSGWLARRATLELSLLHDD